MALDKLKKLREDLTKTKELLDYTHKRETLCEESLNCSQLVFEKRLYVRRLKKILGINTPDFEISPEKPKKRFKKTIEDVGESTRIRIPANRLRDAASYVGEADLDSMMQIIHAAELEAIDQKVEKAKSIDEQLGFVDFTEVDFCCHCRIQFYKMKRLRLIGLILTLELKIIHNCLQEVILGEGLGEVDGLYLIVIQHVKKLQIPQIVYLTAISHQMIIYATM
jgi:hypothetical protein